MVQNSKPKVDGRVFGVTSLTAGILSIVISGFVYLSIPLAVVAIVFGVLGIRQPESRNLATAGLIIGIVGAVYALLALTVWLIELSKVDPEPVFRFKSFHH